MVAIRKKDAPAGSSWWLVDSTNFRLLDRDWTPNAKSFQAFDTVFWIGYCGPLSEYPVHGPEQLKEFYAKTLATVPREFLERNLCQFDFTVDPSLVGKDGYLNPRIPEFIHMQERVLSDYGVKTLRKVRIVLTRGDGLLHHGSQVFGRQRLDKPRGVEVGMQPEPAVLFRTRDTNEVWSCFLLNRTLGKR